MSGLTTIAAIIAMLLIIGGCVGMIDRRNFDVRWLVIAAMLVLVNDALLTRFYGAVPDPLSGSWNWTGKLLALIVSLLIAALPLFGWRRSGITLSQERAGRGVTYAVIAVTALIFVGVALALPNEPIDGQTLGFQLTMPGLEEEVFYRGILLLALNEAFRGRWQFLGINWGWGAVLSSLLFGLAHGFSFGANGFSVDLVAIALTGGPALILVWVRERTGSVLWPILLHNFANSIPLLL